jgi:hypothetical protein
MNCLNGYDTAMECDTERQIDDEKAATSIAGKSGRLTAVRSTTTLTCSGEMRSNDFVRISASGAARPPAGAGAIFTSISHKGGPPRPGFANNALS